MRLFDFPSPTTLELQLWRAGLLVDGQVADALRTYTTALSNLVWLSWDQHQRSQSDPAAKTDKPVHAVRADADKALEFMREALRVSGAFKPRGIQ